ncbi:MAG: M48 family metalloprotease [Alphaproteobacteria bacterium]|nr:M48 family metalloprotease [Alphaproteobacteria bacterium]
MTTNQPVEFKPRINTFSDRVNFVINGLGSVGTLAVAAHYTNPYIAGAALGTSYLIVRGISGFLYKQMESEFENTPASQLPAGSEELRADIQKMSEKLRLKKTPNLFVFGDNKWRYRGQPIKEAFSEVFCKYANAAVYGINSFGLLTSNKLLTNLSSEEEVAVLGHELGHARAGHAKRHITINSVSSAAQIAGSVNYTLKFLTSWVGFEAYLVGVCGEVAAQIGLGRLGFKSKNETQKKIIEKTSYVAKTGAIFAFSAAKGRYDIIAAWGLATGLTMASKYFALRDSRYCEYQADRIGAEVTGKPRALCSALRTLEDMQIDDISYEKGDSLETAQGRKKFMRFKAWALEPTSTHPTTSHRCKRLRKMVRRLESASPEAA